MNKLRKRACWLLTLFFGFSVLYPAWSGSFFDTLTDAAEQEQAGVYYEEPYYYQVDFEEETPPSSEPVKEESKEGDPEKESGETQEDGEDSSESEKTPVDPIEAMAEAMARVLSAFFPAGQAPSADLIKFVTQESVTSEPDNPEPDNPEPDNPNPDNPDPDNPDPDNPEPDNPNPDNPDPDNPEPDNPEPDNPNPDNPEPDNPNPDNPNPDNPNPDNPNPDNPNPDNPNPDNPNPDNPNPDNPEPQIPTSFDVAEWKQYVSAKYGFELKESSDAEWSGEQLNATHSLLVLLPKSLYSSVKTMERVRRRDKNSDETHLPEPEQITATKTSLNPDKNRIIAYNPAFTFSEAEWEALLDDRADAGSRAPRQEEERAMKMKLAILTYQRSLASDLLRSMSEYDKLLSSWRSTFKRSENDLLAAFGDYLFHDEYYMMVNDKSPDANIIYEFLPKRQYDFIKDNIMQGKEPRFPDGTSPADEPEDTSF